MALTKRQKEILDFLKAFIDENGYSPSFEEICAAFGYTSLATVHEHLTNLATKGYIRKAYRESRSIEFPPETEPSVPLPLLGTVAAGQPIEAVQDTESLAIPGEMIRRGSEHYVLRVSGESMIDEQIRDGDHIVVSARQTADDGEMVVALVRDEAATVKKLYREPDNRVRLQPANRDMEPIIEDAGDVRIQGVVVGLVRTY
ncbi:MAG: transcriptional repressor LexA [Gemmatimonadetes bacterium]|nr:transcriptional repressor LexA [Gemmatimonadota bacterium]MDE2676960.1 transcriptional repressor LexA [Gemmatimonadota bacterium]MXX33441.1 transcriptional repressor LexA [Gemmatimonadota bacterium]MYA11378.1 transcriptional repressor LexA [Gemmatimonadota bacterium]MYD13193.1 transcriptional repressor LexA [Gemmatimonadota bacterium]